MIILEISVLPSDYLIMTINENEAKTSKEAIFLVRSIKIKNSSEKKVSIKELQFDIKSKATSRQKISYVGEVLSDKTKQVERLIQMIGVKQEHPLAEASRLANAQFFMGKEEFWNHEDYTSGFDLEPGQETGIRLEVFRIVSSSPVDELDCTIIYEQEKEERTETLSIPIKTYKTKNDYILPVKGAWIVWGNSDDTTSHRTMHSQEFGMDLMQFNDDLMIPQVGSTPNEEFKMYNKEVIAVGDATVIDCFDGSPENPAAPDMLPDEEVAEIAEKYGFAVAASGNHVILKHPNDEYSLYAHLGKNSVVVEKGQKVKQGQILGRLGNSGSSTGPHLHFHLMAGPSLMTSRGLPCHFTNIVDVTGQKIEFIQKNFMVVHSR